MTGSCYVALAETPKGSDYRCVPLGLGAPLTGSLASQSGMLVHGMALVGLPEVCITSVDIAAWSKDLGDGRWLQC